MVEIERTKGDHSRMQIANVGLLQNFLKRDSFQKPALRYAKSAIQDHTGMSYHYTLTLAHAYLMNERYDEALRNYKYALSIISDNSSLDYFWKQITEASKNANDKERYKQMLDALKKILFHQNTQVLNKRLTNKCLL